MVRLPFAISHELLTMFKVDFHTHSTASSDGGIAEHEYEEIIAKRILDVVAITDHNRIDMAQKLHAKLGDTIIVGEEIMTQAGEIIGLFLRTKVRPWLSLQETMRFIHAQGGLVYIPHPFDTTRHGIGEKNLTAHTKRIDIIEGFNGRMIFPWYNRKAQSFAKVHHMLMGAGSDAHSRGGIGRVFTEVVARPTKDSLKKELQRATYVTRYLSWQEYFMPTWNRWKKMRNTFA